MEAAIREARDRHGRIPPPLKEQIVLEHTALIQYVVGRIAARLPSHVDIEDLHNTGVIGLIDAVDRFDPSKDCKFRTYAEFRIRGAILDQLRALDWAPRSVRQRGRLLERAAAEVEQRLGHRAGPDEIADFLGIEIDEFHALTRQTRGISLVSLEDLKPQTDAGSRGPSGDVEDPKGPDPLEALSSRETMEALSRDIAELPEKERLVISLYYYEDLSLKEIGTILGVTESRICQIHSKAVGRLRNRHHSARMN